MSPKVRTSRPQASSDSQSSHSRTITNCSTHQHHPLNLTPDSSLSTMESTPATSRAGSDISYSPRQSNPEVTE